MIIYWGFLPASILLVSKLLFFHLYPVIFSFSLLLQRDGLKQRGGRGDDSFQSVPLYIDLGEANSLK